MPCCARTRRIIGRIFSARARLKPHSDLDLALEGPPLKPHQAYALREAFSESDLPMRVDTVALNDLPREWEIRA